MRDSLACCQNADFVQKLHRDTSEFSWPWWRNVLGGSWWVDSQVPYPNVQHGAITLTLTDRPGFDSFSSLLRIKMDFVSCLVCFDKGRCGELLGCIEWGHEFYTVGKQWNVIRYIRGTTTSYVVGPRV